MIGGKDSSWAGSFLGNVVEGAASVVASPFKAIDRALAAAAGTEYREMLHLLFQNLVKVSKMLLVQ